MVSALTMFVIFSIISYLGAKNIATQIVHSMTAERMNKELDYLLKDLGDSYWENIDGGLYCNGNYYGNGTPEEAKLDKFLNFEENTGTFCYTFILDNEAELGSVEATDTRLAYDQGHYLRVSGSALSPDGKSIVGTYMTKNVSDILDTDRRYQGIANVDGGLIYCIYKTLDDANGNIVGAVVVGRNLTVINNIITEYSLQHLLIILFVILIAAIIIIKILNPLINNINKINNYIKRIDGYFVPSEKLEVSGTDEIYEIGNNINQMVDKIKLANAYRTLAETDNLTGMHNRLYISLIFDKIRDTIIKENKSFCLEVIDVDFFKQYNDNYGHQEGDKCLQMVADALKSVADDERIYASRWGGDEFLLMYIDCTKEEIKAIEKQIFDKIHTAAMPHEYSKVNNIVTITQGAFIFKDIKDKSFADLFTEADHVLYSIKKHHKDDFDVRN